MDIYSALHRRYSQIKSWRRKRVTPPLSAVRRINKVFPPSGTRLVAMTFDDGPTSAPSRPGSRKGITSSILEIMANFGAKGTFDVIGSTEENYPDECGAPGSFKWGGVKYDHYPKFGEDSSAGAANQKELVAQILAQSHEISNHGYRHIAFGPEKIVYGSRAHFQNEDEVLRDLYRLHNLIMDEFGYRITLGRPPHYIDRIPGGSNSYKVYEKVGYQYLGASFDGGGWRASTGSLEKDITAMVEPLKKALEEDPGSLNGQIIFEKDGYNMSLEAPVVYALPQKLQLLKAHGYSVVTVSELLKNSQFEDVDPKSDLFKAIAVLHSQGKPAVYRDNTFRGDLPCRIGEMKTWLRNPNCTLPNTDSAQNDKLPLTPGELSKIAGENGYSVPTATLSNLESPVLRQQAAIIAATMQS